MYVAYFLFGMVLALFNKFFGLWVYRLALLLTDKLQVSDMFLFRVDETNRDSFFFLTRSFCVLFGLMLSFAALYFLFV